MLLGSFRFQVSGTALFKNFKAPKGKQYLIKSVIFVIQTSGNNTVVLLDYNIEEHPFGVGSVGSAFMGFEVINTNSNNVQYFVEVETKYFCVTALSTATIDCDVYVHGDLIPISKKEAILEWFRKGR